jgi:hypothetical protein
LKCIVNGAQSGDDQHTNKPEPNNRQVEYNENNQQQQHQQSQARQQQKQQSQQPQHSQQLQHLQQLQRQQQQTKKETVQQKVENSNHLETIDGVEIASSYNEYLDLALNDLVDRVEKSQVKLNDFRERINKRTTLLKDINKEIDHRNTFSIELNARDKLLRTRLIRNTEMKSALQNLADIAGYKLNFSLPKTSHILNNRNSSLTLNSRHINEVFTSSIPFSLSNDNTTYTRYIEMAYSEVDTILDNDKSTLIEVIREIKENNLKLNELKKLKIKVELSLKRLTEFEEKLTKILKNDSQVAKTVQTLESRIKENN